MDADVSNGFPSRNADVAPDHYIRLDENIHSNTLLSQSVPLLDYLNPDKRLLMSHRYLGFVDINI